MQIRASALSSLFAPVYCMNRYFAALAALVLLAACGSDETKNGTNCPAGEVFNPIAGACQPAMSDNNGTPDMGENNATDASNNGGDDTGNGGDDTGNNDPDMPPSDNCRPGVDTDNDGLTDDCECQSTLATSPTNPDTDGDGLLDGEEDANHNCVVDYADGETSPRMADTDVDGATDSEEIAAGTDPLVQDGDGDGILDGPEIASCLDPFSDDTDNDGLPDGVEDGNQDGMLGNCPNHMFDYACAQGESNPCSSDSDGDGTPDSDEAQYRDCRPEDLQGLITPQLVVNMTADYQLGVDPSMTTAPVVAGTAQAHAFQHAGARVTGFIGSFTPPNGETASNRISDHIVSVVQGIYPTAVGRVGGRQITSHDGHRATVGAIVDLPAGTALQTARDEVIGALAGVPAASVNTGLTGTFAGDAQPTLFVYEVLARSASQYIIVGAFVTLTDYQNDAGISGILVDDITGGSAVAGAMETLQDDCVAYTVTVRPKVDIIVSIDGSGSMSDEQAALQNFAIDFTTLLTNSNLDWRVGVTRPDCGGDTNLSMEVKQLFQGAGCFIPPFPTPIPGFPGTSNTGELVGGDFTADPNELRTRLDPGIFSGGDEYTASALTAAADLALPRSDTNPAKFRTDAAVILIAITDEEDAVFQDKLSWGNSQLLTLDMTQQMELETKTQDWISSLLRPELGATMFGIIWPPSDQCASGNGAAVAHAVAHIANETGGSVGSICQADITNTLVAIADATAGIASGLRLRGVPLPPTIEVTHGSAQSGAVVDMPRSRTAGFDYDSIVNRVSFTGPMPPQTNDRVIIPYRRWENSVFMCVSTSDCPAEQKLKCVSGECR